MIQPSSATLDYHDGADPAGYGGYLPALRVDAVRRGSTGNDSVHAESQSGARAPKHSYSLADYGLTVPEMVRSGSPGCDSVCCLASASHWSSRCAICPPQRDNSPAARNCLITGGLPELSRPGDGTT